MKVNLEKIIEGMESCNFDCIYYYNPNKNDIFFTNSSYGFDYNPKNIDEHEIESLIYESYPLPTQYEINEFKMMEDFTNDIGEIAKQEILYNALKSKRPFRKFKDCIYNFSLKNEWFKFREQRYKEIAIEWCDYYKLDYTDNLEIVKE